MRCYVDLQCVLFVMTRTDDNNISETISTLTFGNSARNISTHDPTRRKKKQRAAGGHAAGQDDGWVAEDV